MSLSLLGSINVCKVNVGYSDKLQSDRFENPENMTCPLWNGTDTYGRPVNADSFYTKTAGCNSAEDRVKTENFLRPQYIEYVALDAMGFRNPTMYNTTTNNPPSMGKHQQLVEGFAYTPSNGLAYSTAKESYDINKIVGQAGYQYSNNNTPYSDGVCGVSGNANCNSCSSRGRAMKQNMYEGFQQQDRRAMQNFEQRRMNSAVAGMHSYAAHQNAGF
jgi:hypothetical protein